MAVSASRSSKRKSTESNGETTEQMLKKIKVAKSADRPKPTKSALKKDDVDAVVAGEKKSEKLPAVLDTAKKPATKTSGNNGAVPKDEVAAKSSSKKTKASTAAAVKDKPAKTGKQADSLSVSKKSKDTRKPSNVPEEELVDSDDEENGNNSALTPDQTAALIAGFESSDEETDDEEDGIPVDKLPKAPVDKAQANAAADAAQAQAKTGGDPETTPGVIYIGRIPHGFFEKQMKAYFGQFGEITHLRLGRNKKTKRSMHYAFVEFASSAVADIVAKTMDKYLMFNHILQVRRVPSEQVKENIWKGEGKRKRPMPLNRIEGVKLNKGTTKEGWDKRIQRETKKRNKNAARLAEIGYDFDAPALKGLEDDAASEKLLGGAKPDEPKSIEASAGKNVSNSSKKRSAVATETTKKAKKSKTNA